MKLNEALIGIARDLGLDPRELQEYAAAWDGTRHIKKNGIRPFVHLTDRKILYALVRATKPRNVLESGTSYGNGANVILAALADNGFGQLTTVDIVSDRGEEIDPEYTNVQIIGQDIVEFVHNYTGTGYDFIHEDSSHEVHTVRVVYENLPKLAPEGCVIISHDVGTGVRDAIRTGIYNAGYGHLKEWQPNGSLGYTTMRYHGKE